MSAEIEVPVGGRIKAYGSELVCVKDYTDKDGYEVGCRACPLYDSAACVSLACCFSTRTDFEDIHFEYYYGKKK